MACLRPGRCAARPGCSARAARYPPRPTAPECSPRAPRVRRASAPHGLPSYECDESRCPQSPARARSAARAATRTGSCPMHALRRRGAPLTTTAALPDSAHAPHSRCRDALRAVARAASSVFGGKARSRDASATSACATTQRARASGSFAPNPRAAPRSKVFAFTKSPSCAIAMPRSASAGGSLRSATSFSAPSGSPAASERPAALINESIEFPTNLSLPPC